MSKEYIELIIGGTTYNLQLSCLDKFRTKFGISMNGIDETKFITWARENNIKFHKEVCIEVVVDIDEYIKDMDI